MSQENVEIVRAQFEATNRGDFATPMAHWANDIEVVVQADVSSGLGSEHAGREAAGEFFGDWFRTFRPVHFEVLEIRDAGDAVVAVVRHRATGRQSGVEVSDDVFYEYRLRDGKIVRVAFHNTWADALEAAGLRE